MRNIRWNWIIMYRENAYFPILILPFFYFIRALEVYLGQWPSRIKTVLSSPFLELHIAIGLRFCQGDLIGNDTFYLWIMSCKGRCAPLPPLLLLSLLLPGTMQVWWWLLLNHMDKGKILRMAEQQDRKSLFPDTVGTSYQPWDASI